ncbi:hypothetical protein PspLS_09653 [Pyricularia sp. CBS 133598]|nr:hypothetical protein PspLS_09653 [Pyricularia sp. CBS 133598]
MQLRTSRPFRCRTCTSVAFVSLGQPILPPRCCIECAGRVILCTVA